MKDKGISAFLPACGLREMGGGLGWNTVEFRDLGSLIESDFCLAERKIEEIYKDPELLHEIIAAIPTPFARMWHYFFTIAQPTSLNLSSGNLTAQFVSKFKKNIEQEIVNILMLLAVRNELLLEVTIEPIRLCEDYSDGECKPLDEPFIKTLTTSIPDFYNHPEWHEFKVVRYKGKIIGITSPLTMIIPAPHYDKLTVAKYIKNSIKNDPLWKVGLYKYLEVIERELRSLSKGEESIFTGKIYNNPALNTIDVLLRFIKRQKEELQITSDNLSRFEYVHTNALESINDLTDIILILDTHESDFRLVGKGGTVVIPTLDSIYSKSGDGKRIYGFISTYSLEESNAKELRKFVEESFEKIKDKYKHKLIEESSIDEEGSPSGGHRSEGFFSEDEIWEDAYIDVEGLYPLRLDFVESIREDGLLTEVLQSFTKKNLPGGKVECSFSIRLRRGGKVTYKKVLRKITPNGAVPVVAFIPWVPELGGVRYTYVCSINPVDVDPNLRWEVANSDNLSLLVRERSITIYEYRGELWAVQYYYGEYRNVAIPDVGSNTDTSILGLYHMALIIDIGTSNTVYAIIGVDTQSGDIKVFYPDEFLTYFVKHVPSSVSLDDNVQIDYKEKDGMSIRSILMLYFFSPLGNPFMDIKYFPTLYKIFSYISRDSEIRLAFTGGKPIIMPAKFLKFLKEPHSYVMSLINQIVRPNTDIKHTIKWQSDMGESDQRMFNYLRDIYFSHLLTWAVNEEKRHFVVFSHPQIKREYIYDIREFVEGLGGQPVNIPEPYAFIRYYDSISQFPGSNIIGFDIGGGTTDIIFRIDGKMGYTSIRFAGKHILIDTIVSYLEIFARRNNKLYDPKLDKFIMYIKEGLDIYLFAKLAKDNAILNENNLQEILKSYINDVKKELKYTKKKIEVSPIEDHMFVKHVLFIASFKLLLLIILTGAIYLRLLYNLSSKNDKLTTRLPIMFFGGNGSRLLSILKAIVGSKEEIFNELSERLITASEISINLLAMESSESREGSERAKIIVQFSDKPKMEVIMGLIHIFSHSGLRDDITGPRIDLEEVNLEIRISAEEIRNLIKNALFNTLDIMRNYQGIRFEDRSVGEVIHERRAKILPTSIMGEIESINSINSIDEIGRIIESVLHKVSELLLKEIMILSGGKRKIE